MTRVSFSFAVQQNNTVIVAGVPGRIILVARYMVGFFQGGCFWLISDPGGAGQAELTPHTNVGGLTTIDALLGARYGLAVERGKSLGISTQPNGTPETCSLMLWYELVD